VEHYEIIGEWIAVKVAVMGRKAPESLVVVLLVRVRIRATGDDGIAIGREVPCRSK
jgi:hypothetical protein